MLKKVFALGLVSAALGVISLPAQAQDTAIIQRSTTDVYIDGEGNDAVQVNSQVNHTRRVNGRGSAATVQDAYSGAVILGEDNGVYQEQTQVSIDEEINRRPRNRRRRGGDIYIRQR